MIRRLLVCAALLGLAALPELAVLRGLSPSLSAQETRDGAARTDSDGPLRIAARVSADTVLVGEPFTIGVVVAGAGASDPAIPQLLQPGEGWEQLEVARIESSGSAAGETRAYYRVVAWEPGRLELPALRVETHGERGRAVEIELPAPRVRSMLPEQAEAVELRLRGPRPPLESGWPWWIWALLALLAAALAAWWWRMHRAPEGVEPGGELEMPDPVEMAREALVALRERAVAGELDAGEFYDRLEEILRAYLADTRDWPATRPVRSAAWARRDAMRELHRHAVFSRFAGVEADGKRLVTDADVSLDWVTEDAAA